MKRTELFKSTTPTQAKKKTNTPTLTASFPKTSRVTNKISEEARRDRIAQKAYELYQQRGGQNGNDLGDWFEAERLVKS